MELSDYELYLSDWVKTKLLMKEPPISIDEVEEAFFNCTGIYIKEVRSEHETIPPTFWFISDTSECRVLKICFIPIFDKKRIILKTAFDAEEWEIDEYESYK